MTAAVSEIHRELTVARTPLVDGLLRLQGLAGRALALPPLLDAMVRVVASVLEADVVSVYLRDADAPEGIDRLVMAANVGFPESAVGHVVLAYGEGITGFAAECLRPVATSDAASDAHFKPISGLGEERFQAFLAVPFLVDGRAAGVLVAQREATRAFGDDSLPIGLAAAGAVAHAVDRARFRARTHGVRPPPSPVRLDGVPLSPGVALGVASMMPTWGDLQATADRASGPADPVSDTLRAVVAQLRDELRRGLGKIAEGPRGGRLAAAAAALDDARLAKRIDDATAAHGAVAGLREVAREYALAPLRAEDERSRAWLLERAREVEDFCLLAAAKLQGAPLPGQGAALLVPDRLGLWLAVLALGRGVGSVAVAGPVAADDPAIGLTREAGRPAIAEVAGVYGWVRPGDRVLVDGTAGWLRVHPSLADVARLRRQRRR